jgi:Peptidase inhibitor family I36
MKSIRFAVPVFTLIAVVAMHGGCVDAEIDAESVSHEEAAVQMIPWGGIARPEIAQVLSDHPGGVLINENQIAWDDGKVVLTIPNGRQPQPEEEQQNLLGSVYGCPSGWFCFYEHINFNTGTSGRRLQFSLCSTGGVAQYLRDYGFENKTSSWVVNRSLNFVNVNDFGTGSNLWNGRAYSRSSWVGSTANDKADWFICYL